MSLAVQVIHAARAIAAVCVDESSHAGRSLTESDVVVFLTVCDAGETTASRLTEVLRRDKTTISRSIARLASENLISPELDPRDGRQKLIRPTRSGYELGDVILSMLRSKATAAASDLSVDEVEAVEIFLRRLDESER